MTDNITDLHDPLPRKLEDEPYFSLLGRDPRAPGFARLYAIVRERGPDATAKAHAALDAILLANDGIDPRPHKDKQHAWSARAKADELSEWYRLNMEAKSQSGKINTGPEIKVSDILPAPITAMKVTSETILAPGDRVTLVAPIHYRKARPGPYVPLHEFTGEKDTYTLGQIATGTLGTIRDLDEDMRNYVIAFDGHPESNHLVAFDRVRIAPQ